MATQGMIFDSKPVQQDIPVNINSTNNIQGAKGNQGTQGNQDTQDTQSSNNSGEMIFDSKPVQQDTHVQNTQPTQQAPSDAEAGTSAVEGALGAAGIPVNPITTGIGKGALETAHTLGRVVNAATGDRISALPNSFNKPEYLESSNIAETAGKVGEGVLEFLLGDEALKGLSLPDKLSKIAPIIEKYPKIAEAAVNIARQSAVSGAQSGLHGQDPVTGAEYGAAGGAAGEVLGAAGAKYLAPRTTKAVEEQAANVLEHDRAIVSENSENAARTFKTTAKSAAENASNVPVKVNVNAPWTQFTFGDAADHIKNAAQPIFDKLDDVSDGEFQTLRNQQKTALKVLRSPFATSVEDVSKAQDAYNKASSGIQDILDKSDLNQTDLANAKSMWRKASTLELLDAKLDKAFTESSEFRQASGNLPELKSPKALMKSIDNTFSTIGTDKLVDALGADNAKKLIDLHDEFKKLVNINDNGNSFSAAINKLKSKIGLKPKEYGTAGDLASAAFTHYIGLGKIGGLAAAIHWAYTHPDIAYPIIKGLAQSSPYIAQGVKQAASDK